MREGHRSSRHATVALSGPPTRGWPASWETLTRRRTAATGSGDGCGSSRPLTVANYWSVSTERVLVTPITTEKRWLPSASTSTDQWVTIVLACSRLVELGPPLTQARERVAVKIEEPSLSPRTGGKNPPRLTVRRPRFRPQLWFIRAQLPKRLSASPRPVARAGSRGRGPASRTGRRNAAPPTWSIASIRVVERRRLGKVPPRAVSTLR